MRQLQSTGPGNFDICELCGGDEARTSQLAIRRQLAVGESFDLVCGVDLGDHATQREVIRYIHDNNVLLVVMAPACRSVGPTSNLNYNINHRGWNESFNTDLPHLQFCGKVALVQQHVGRYWFVETSTPTWLWNVIPWDQVVANEQTERVEIHQCMLWRR